MFGFGYSMHKTSQFLCIQTLGIPSPGTKSPAASPRSLKIHRFYLARLSLINPDDSSLKRRNLWQAKTQQCLESIPIG